MENRHEQQSDDTDWTSTNEHFHASLERLQQLYGLLEQRIVEYDKKVRKAFRNVLDDESNPEESHSTDQNTKDEKKSDLLNFVKEQKENWQREVAELKSEYNKQYGIHINQLAKYEQLFEEATQLRLQLKKSDERFEQLKQAKTEQSNSIPARKQSTQSIRVGRMKQENGRLQNELDECKHVLSQVKQKLDEECRHSAQLRERNQVFQNQLWLNYKLDKQKNYSTIVDLQLPAALHVDSNETKHHQKDSSHVSPAADRPHHQLVDRDSTVEDDSRSDSHTEDRHDIGKCDQKAPTIDNELTQEMNPSKSYISTSNPGEPQSKSPVRSADSASAQPMRSRSQQRTNCARSTSEEKIFGKPTGG